MYRNIYVLDDTHRAYFLYSGDHNLFGLVVQHDCVDGNNEELLPFREGGYILVNEDPITLDKFILCHECGDFGHILDGEWKKYIHEVDRDV